VKSNRVGKKTSQENIERENITGKLKKDVKKDHCG
jgi:hypothetical protein